MLNKEEIRSVFRDKTLLPKEITSNIYYNEKLLSELENNYETSLKELEKEYLNNPIKFKTAYSEGTEFLNFETNEVKQSYWNKYSQEYEVIYYSVFDRFFAPENFSLLDSMNIDEDSEEIEDDLYDFLFFWLDSVFKDFLYTLEEIFQVEFPKYHEKLKFKKEKSIYSIQEDEEYSFSSEEEAEKFIMGKYYKDLNNLYGYFEIVKEIESKFIGNNLDIYSISSLAKKRFRTPSPTEMNEAYDLEWKFRKDWEDYLPDEIKRKSNISSKVNYIKKIKYKKENLSDFEKAQIEKKEISEELFLKALYSINKIAKIYSITMKKNYNILNKTALDYYDENYSYIQDNLRNRKIDLYYLKAHALSEFSPKEIHLSNPTISWKKVKIEEIEDIDKFLLANPGSLQLNKYAILSNKKRKKISKKEKEKLEQEIGGYNVPILSNYEKFVYFDLNNYQFHIPLNDWHGDILNLKERVIPNFSKSISPEEKFIEEKEAIKIIQSFLEK